MISVVTPDAMLVDVRHKGLTQVSASELNELLLVLVTIANDIEETEEFVTMAFDETNPADTFTINEHPDDLKARIKLCMV